MAFVPSSPSKHNVMLGARVSHPSSTNFDDADDFEKRPVKRLRRTPSPGRHSKDARARSSPRKTISPRTAKTRTIADSDDELDSEELILGESVEHKTQLETALPPIRTDKEAIAEYEAARAAELAAAEIEGIEAQESSAEDTTAGRLEARKWTRGKSSIYVDAFNLALDTVLEDESHLFNAAEAKVFADWRALSYEAQYLYVRLFLRKTSSWHRVSRLGYHGDIADLEAATSELQRDRELPDCVEEGHAAPGEWEPPVESVLGGQHYTFADRSEECITTLEEASSLLLLDELKAIAKDAKVQGKNKTELLGALRRTSGKQSGLGFLRRTDTEDSVASVDSVESGASTPSRGENRDAHFVAKIMAETGSCIRLSQAVHKLFERVHLVFYRSTEWTEKSLTTIILARISRWNFPEYLVSRSANIFPSRSLLLEFETAVRTQFRIDNILEFNGPATKEKMQVILDIFEEVFPRWRVLLREEQKKEDSIYATGEGAYLRRLSPAWVYTRIVHKGAFVMGTGKFKHRLREHETLTALLDQKLFHTSRRGDWYIRKALLEEHYMFDLRPDPKLGPDANKRLWTQQALVTCEEALQDPLTHLIFHHDLQKRVVKLEKRLKVPKRSQHDFGHVRLAKAVERTFYGVQVIRADGANEQRRSSITAANNISTNLTVGGSSSSGPTNPTNRRGAKTIWLDPALPTGQYGTCSVEEMCLSLYRRKEGWRGYHSEGSVVRTLFALLFADVLFAYAPNVFQTAYQTCPLDLHTDAFFPCRVSEINARLNEIANGGAAAIVESFYDANEDRRTCVVGLDWAYDRRDMRSVVACWSRDGLAAVMKVMAQEYAARGGGVPDLFLWREFDPVTLEVRPAPPAASEGAGETAAGEKGEREVEAEDGSGAVVEKDEIKHEALDEREKDRRRALLDAGQKGEVMFAEVKSENDRLSDTQRMWIDVLTGAGVRVELCHALASETRVERA